MTILRKAAALAVMTGAGLVGTSGFASAAITDDNTWTDSATHTAGDDGTGMGGLIPVDAAKNVGVNPNIGCAADRLVPDLTAQGIVGLVPVGVNLAHLLQNVDLAALNTGSTTNTTHDEGCTSNQGASHSGDDSHGSTGAGNSDSESSDAKDAGSHNEKSGAGGGGLLGATGIAGAGGMDDKDKNFAHAG